MANIIKLIKKVAGEEPKNVVAFTSGTVSEAYAFEINLEGFVLRMGDNQLSYYKDMYSFNNFSSSKLPIPKIVYSGKFEKKYFSISKKAKGKILREYDKKTRKSMIPKIMAALLEIIHTKVESTKFGPWGKNGKSFYNSWKSFLSDFKFDIRDKTLKKRLIKDILKYIKYCPENINLIHGDFGYNNIVSDGQEITAVIDWSSSKYGDFLYDIAWLTFWSSKTNYLLILNDFFKENRFLLKDAEARVLCYINHIALEVLSYNEFRNNKESYEIARSKFKKSLEKLL